MIERLGGVVAGCAFLIELDGLNGREAIEGYDTKVLMNSQDKSIYVLQKASGPFNSFKK